MGIAPVSSGGLAFSKICHNLMETDNGSFSAQNFLAKATLLAKERNYYPPRRIPGGWGLYNKGPLTP
jgi:hypothetical protein